MSRSQAPEQLAIEVTPSTSPMNYYRSFSPSLVTGQDMRSERGALKAESDSVQKSTPGPSRPRFSTLRLPISTPSKNSSNDQPAQTDAPASNSTNTSIFPGAINLPTPDPHLLWSQSPPRLSTSPSISELAALPNWSPSSQSSTFPPSVSTTPCTRHQILPGPSFSDFALHSTAIAADLEPPLDHETTEQPFIRILVHPREQFYHSALPFLNNHEAGSSNVFRHDSTSRHYQPYPIVPFNLIAMNKPNPLGKKNPPTRVQTRRSTNSATAEQTLAKAPSKKNLRTASNPTAAKKTSDSTKTSSAGSVRSRQASNTTTKRSSSKQVRQPIELSDSDDDDDGQQDNLMDVDDAPAPATKSKILKRKSSRQVSKTATVNEPEDSEDSAELPQPKKSKGGSTTSGRDAPHPPAILDGQASANKTKKSSNEKSALVAAQKAVLEKQNADLKDRLAATEAEIRRLTEVNVSAQKELTAITQLIPRPPGERGKNGWNLQDKMGLKNDKETYGNIRRCVRYAIYKAQLDIWIKINQQDQMSIFTCYSLVKQQFPLMGQFEGSWATRELIKGICSNARRHCRKKHITDPRLPVELLKDDEDEDEEQLGNFRLSSLKDKLTNYYIF
ncbi:hypothetical protein FRB90_000441 [Tulasnella sp. 427]|nr:hypothetical protein FRB90_000441 [Tulasnella sp. 427]